MRNLPVWIFSSLLTLMLVTSLTPLLVQGQNDIKTERGSRAQLVCTLSSFFALEPFSRISSSQQLSGRGIISCQSENGFKTEHAILADLQLTMSSRPASSFYSLDSRPFVIPREIGQIEDIYRIRLPTRTQDEATTLLHGHQNDLVISLKLTSHQHASEHALLITSLRLRFDESAPDFF